MMLSDTPEQLRCLWRHLRLVNLIEVFIQGTTMNKQISLFVLWRDTLTRQQSNLKLLLTENLLNLFDNQTG